MADKGDDKRPLSLGGRPGGKIEIRKPIETGSVRQSFPHGRSKTVQVEVRRKRTGPGAGPSLGEKPETLAPAISAKPAASPAAPGKPLAEGPAAGGDAESLKRAAEAAQRAADKVAEDSRREVAERAGKA